MTSIIPMRKYTIPQQYISICGKPINLFENSVLWKLKIWSLLFACKIYIIISYKHRFSAKEFIQLTLVIWLMCSGPTCYFILKALCCLKNLIYLLFFVYVTVRLWVCFSFTVNLIEIPLKSEVTPINSLLLTMHLPMYVLFAGSDNFGNVEKLLTHFNPYLW